MLPSRTIRTNLNVESITAMSPDLDASLCARWPLIFAQRHADTLESGMGRGFECGDGWYGLIYGLCAALQDATDHNGEPQVVASQVKEKFGSLRFYALGLSERQRGMIDAAREISRHIAEE